MSRIWREKADPQKHSDFMNTRSIGGMPIEASKDNLIVKWVYFVEVCNFTFQFENLEQVLECKEYFSKSIHPSTRESGHDLEHYWQSWECRLPKGLTKKSKREKVLKALNELIKKYNP